MQYFTELQNLYKLYKKKEIGNSQIQKVSAKNS